MLSDFHCPVRQKTIITYFSISGTRDILNISSRNFHIIMVFTVHFCGCLILRFSGFFLFFSLSITFVCLTIHRLFVFIILSMVVLSRYPEILDMTYRYVCLLMIRLTCTFKVISCLLHARLYLNLFHINSIVPFFPVSFSLCVCVLLIKK